MDGVKSCDLLVIGSGAAALSAALKASETMQVLMVEKEPLFGGQTARSGGGIWIPNNHHAAREGIVDSPEAAHTYFRHELGNRYDAARVGAFIDKGPEVLKYIETRTSLEFEVLKAFPDCRDTSPGALQGGRSLFPKPWDGAELGSEIRRLRPVFAAATFMGAQVGVGDVPFFLSGTRKLKSLFHVTRVMMERARDQLRAKRPLRLTSGNAVVGALAAAALRNGVQLWTSAPAVSLLREDGRVVGATVDRPDGRVRIEARCGVVIATGGFHHDGQRRSALFSRAAQMPEFWGLYPTGNTGDGIRLAEDVGGVLDEDMKSAVGYTAATTLVRGEGQNEVLPMFFNRAVPGTIHVSRRGKRFANEARAPHDWADALIDATQGDGEPIAWVICDHRALRSYGLGVVRPAPFPYRAHVRSGYLKVGQTLHELGLACGIDADQLVQTVAEFNGGAREGRDPHFNRGASLYEMLNGDLDHKPNPCVGPIEKGPFFAVRIYAGAICTFAGLKTNEHAQVLDQYNRPIDGLYAAGNDMASIAGGDYISAGITIGPALTFGYIAADHAASRRWMVR